MGDLAAEGIGRTRTQGAMMAPSTSRSSTLPLPQRLLVDLMELVAGQPVAVVRRRLRLGAVADARAVASPRPGWCAVFTKALALAAGPALRRTWLWSPWPSWYVH